MHNHFSLMPFTLLGSEYTNHRNNKEMKKYDHFEFCCSTISAIFLIQYVLNCPYEWNWVIFTIMLHFF